MSKTVPNPQNNNRSEKIGEFVSIILRKSNWYANYQFSGKQIRRSLKTNSKKEARRRASIIEMEILAGEYKHNKQTPLISDVVTQYLQHEQAEGRSEKTITKYRYCYDMLLDVAARRKVTRISQVDISLIDQFRAERAAGKIGSKPAALKTVHNDTVIIRQLVNFSIKRGLISDDPLKGLVIKKPKRNPQPCWQRSEVDQILAEAKSPYLEPLTLLAESGARVGEAKWLTWDDVDLNRRLIHIRAKDGWKPKSGDQRAFPMSDRLYAMLRSMPRNGPWVFSSRLTKRSTKDGPQLSDRRLLANLKQILKRLGLKGHLHVFRHSFISFAAIEGVPERVLRKWIGHVDRDILDWYFHLADAQSQEAMQRLSDAAGRIKS